MIKGSPPTARKARTGLFTPPTSIFCARSKSSEDLLTLESYYEDHAFRRAHFYPALRLQDRPIPVRQIGEHHVPGCVRAQRLDYHRQRIGQNIPKGALFGKIQANRQWLDRRAELRVDARLVAARVDAIPAVLRKMDGVQSVQGSMARPCRRCSDADSRIPRGRCWRAAAPPANDFSRSNSRRPRATLLRPNTGPGCDENRCCAESCLAPMAAQESFSPRAASFAWYVRRIEAPAR